MSTENSNQDITVRTHTFTADFYPQDMTAVLAQVASAVVGQFEMQKLLDQIIETTMTTLNAEVCSIFLRKEDDPNKIVCVAGSGFARNIVGIAEYGIGEGLTGWVAKTGRYVVIHSKEQLEREKQEGRWLGKFDNHQFKGGTSEFRNLLTVPLKIKEKILGVIKVENKIGGTSFSDRDLQTFETIANVIALAIENARLQKQSEAQSKKIAETLATVANAVVGQFEREKLLKQILDATMQTLNAEVCSIFLRKDDDLNKIICVAGSGFAEDIVAIAEYEIGEGFTGSVAKLDMEFNIRNPHEFEVLKNQGIKWRQKFDGLQWKRTGGINEFRNLLALPLKIKGEVLGVVKAENKKLESGSSFTEEDLQIFRTIANVIALTIENSRLYQQTQQQLKSISSRAAHRINNQVANYDYVELKLLKEVSKLKEADRQRFSELSQKIGEYTRNLKRMIVEFKDFGKPIALKKETTDINALIHHEVEQYNLKNEASKTVTVHLETDNNIPQFKLDAGRFAESVKEMLENAKRAIEGSKKPGNIYISTRLINRDGKDFVTLRLQDDGPGISKNAVLFTPFQSTDPQRTGLGLSTVKELMRAHGGDIEIEQVAQDKPGTCFEITLPIVKE